MLNYHIVPPQILTWRNFLSSGVCCETSFSCQCIYCRQESNFPPYFGSCFCDPDVQLGNKESVILITMIYLLCTNCPRYMGSAQALATSLTQTWRHQRSPNWVTYESLVNNLPLIYESRGLYRTVPPRIIAVHVKYKIVMHSNHDWQTSRWHGPSVWRWERGGGRMWTSEPALTPTNSHSHTGHP